MNRELTESIKLTNDEFEEVRTEEDITAHLYTATKRLSSLLRDETLEVISETISRLENEFLGYTICIELLICAASQQNFQRALVLAEYAEAGPANIVGRFTGYIYLIMKGSQQAQAILQKKIEAESDVINQSVLWIYYALSLEDGALCHKATKRLLNDILLHRRRANEVLGLLHSFIDPLPPETRALFDDMFKFIARLAPS